MVDDVQLQVLGLHADGCGRRRAGVVEAKVEHLLAIEQLLQIEASQARVRLARGWCSDLRCKIVDEQSLSFVLLRCVRPVSDLLPFVEESDALPIVADARDPGPRLGLDDGLFAVVCWPSSFCLRGDLRCWVRHAPVRTHAPVLF